MKDPEGPDAADPRFTDIVGQPESMLRDYVQDEETEQFAQLPARIPREQLVETPQAPRPRSRPG